MDSAEAGGDGFIQGAHVNDVSENTSENSELLLDAKVERVGRIFVDEVLAKTLVFFSKSLVFMSNSQRCARRAVKFFEGLGVKLNIALAAEDLGIERSLVRKRAARTMRIRFGRGHRRTRRWPP